MKFFLYLSIVIILVLSQLSGSFARKFRSTNRLDEISKTYLCIWDDSKLSMVAGIKTYLKSVSKLPNDSPKDIKAVKQNTLHLIEEVSRITDGCVQSLRQMKMIALHIERLGENKKADTTCNALDKSIEVIEAAAAEIQQCQDTLQNTVNSVVSSSIEELENNCLEVFFNFANLDSQISTTVIAYEKCKSIVLLQANDKLNALLDEVTG